MMNNIPNRWRIHGSFAQTPLLGGVLSHHGVNYLTGKAGNDRNAVVADIADPIFQPFSKRLSPDFAEAVERFIAERGLANSKTACSEFRGASEARSS